MSDQPKLYLAGMGMITPVGFDAPSTAAAVKAGISGYKISDFYNNDDEPITMASVPYIIFENIDAQIEEGSRYNERHDRVIKMAILAIREACQSCHVSQAIPLLLAMPDVQDDEEGLSPLIDNLEVNCQPWISAAKHRNLHSGRAAGMDALDYVFQHLNNLQSDYVLIGGSDSFRDYARIAPLNKEGRLLTESNMDGFAPGEAACFLLLTHKPQLAMKRNGCVIALSAPGMADEPGHLGNVTPYRGEGLDQAFKKALNGTQREKIQRIYSSMNGENHWAKEYGVAYIRSKVAFADPVITEHPADCFGDLGSATAPALIALAAQDLFMNTRVNTHLVYSSSDSAKRGAVVVEKIIYPN